MKGNTDSIIGGLGVLGLALLLAFTLVNFNSPDSGQAELVVNGDEVVLEETPITAEIEEVQTESVITETKTDEVVLDAGALSLDINNLIDNSRTLSEEVLNPNRLPISETELGSEVTSETELTAEEAAETTVSEPAADEEVLGDVLNSNDETELVAEEETEQPSRLGTFFRNLFGHGGSQEDVTTDDVDDESADDGEQVVVTVEAGDTVWDLLISEMDLTPGEAATAINAVRSDLNATGLGFSSGNIDLIYPGERINLTAITQYQNT